MTDEGSALRSTLLLMLAPEIRIWHGQMPLGRVFWGHGVAASSVIAMLYATTVMLDQVVFQQVLVILSALYTMWILVGIWRCADNAAPFWGNLARLLTVAWALNIAFVLLFLQLDLLVRYGRG
ncbi:hypothetical protein [Pseudooceanicola sp.]|uniref:hypothetical protein n=1 Tax=Pseudooceanicola sp. TaxID=1914328 RepID=UPI0026256133|nr:hypothetical protein [Pseudooceanicola sp.]MDF1855865.1 hypothetical protein [Pseudooceanicola sp.]